MTVAFELDGREFVALDGGPRFRFTEAVSLSVRCDTQEEIDAYWDRLSEGGEPGPCGWLKDRFGLSWQVPPGAGPPRPRSTEQEAGGSGSPLQREHRGSFRVLRIGVRRRSHRGAVP